MANFNYSMSPENPFVFVDPFRPSINLSLDNVIINRRRVTTIDNVPLPLSQRHTRQTVFPRQNCRELGHSSYYSPSRKTISEKSHSPPGSSSRNTFGMEVPRYDRSQSPVLIVPSPKLRDSSRSSFPPRSDREALPIIPPRAHEPADSLHEAAITGESTHHPIDILVSPNPASGSRETHRPRTRDSCSEGKSSRDVSEHKHFSIYVAPTSSNAISYYRPPTRSSEVALPSSSPYLSSHIPPLTNYPTPAINPIPPPGHPAPQPPLVHHDSPDLSTCILAFLLDTLPRQIYLHLLLRLPHLYFTHVTRVFEDAEMSMPEIKQMALEANNYMKDPTRDISKMLYLESGFTSPRYDHLSRSWGTFVDSLMAEWKAMNIISVLLLLALLTILQIQSAANDPVTRYATLLSIICAFMSLLYGCIYVIRFGIMRSTVRAAEWAHEAQKTTTGIFWNVWVLLAMPATWLAWSMIFFVVSIMSFIWRTGAIDDANYTPMTSHDALGPRVIITLLLSIGLLNLMLVAATFRRYGPAMDRTWRNRVLAWMHEKFNDNGYIHIDPSHRSQESVLPSSSKPTSRQPPIYDSSQHPLNTSPATPPVSSSSAHAFTEKEIPRGRSASIKPIATFVAAKNPRRHLPASRKRVIKPTKIIGLCADDHSANMIPCQETLNRCQMTKDDWQRLSSELRSTWDPHQLSTIQNILQHWNQTFFNGRGAQIVLCEEFGVPWLKHAIYYLSWKDELPNIKDPYDSIPPHLTGLDILYPLSSGAGLGTLSLFSSRLDVWSDLVPGDVFPDRLLSQEVV